MTLRLLLEIGLGAVAIAEGVALVIVVRRARALERFADHYACARETILRYGKKAS